MAEEEHPEGRNDGATSPVPDEDVKMEEEGIEDAEGEEEEEDTGAVSAGKLGRDHYNAMRNVVEFVNTHKITVRGEEHYPAQLFRRIVNKRLMPDYYEVIKEPVAISTIKQKLLRKSYTEFSQFVRDFAQIVHNAKLYNRPNSGAYNDALAFEEVFKSELDKLVESELISKEDTEFPDLGEIPEATPEPDLPEEEDEPDDEADEDDEDEDDEADDSDEERAGRRGRRGRKSLSGRKRDSSEDRKGGEARSCKRRGRPPRVDTPMEARIKAVLKGIRKFKDDAGRLKVLHFERLPDKGMNPEYYAAVHNPIAIDLIKRKAKRKKYTSLDEFMKDMDLMFNNAKAYNEDDSDVHQAAVDLQVQAHNIAAEEAKKPDHEYLMEDGRLPLPNGILHGNEVYKVGDWVHIQNPNDVTKPIVAQIYRTWQDTDGQQWVNACWYYRPEQTVHQYEKHFFPNEVVKTGQYRDHHIDEVVDRCFVMFFTRYNRGRPRGLDPSKEVYVCEARYNEEKHKLNKIKTWASCLPDEVRERDYEMDMFDVPRKIKKVPSPLLYLIKDDMKETDDIPQPKWGAPNAPPIVGAIHKQPRDENQSPPPEPTPPPPPTPPPAPVRQLPQPDQQSLRHSIDAQGDTNMENASMRQSITSATPAPLPATYQSQQMPPRPQQSASPAPMFNRTESYNRHQHPQNSFSPQTPQPPYGQSAPAPYTPYNMQQMQTHRPQGMPAAPMANTTGYTPTNVRGVETYVMSDTANAAIPLHIREQFQTDEQGRILFFTAPPIDRLPRVDPITGNPLSHTAAYLAKRLEKETATHGAEESPQNLKSGRLSTHEAASLTPQQRKFLDLAHQADAREAREQATAKDVDVKGVQPTTEDNILRSLLLEDEKWWKAYYETVKDGPGDFISYEDFRTREVQLLKSRKQQWEAEDETRAKIRSLCNGGPIVDRTSSNTYAIENARKRLREGNLKVNEKVKLRRILAEHDRKSYTKPTYLDDFDPRYGPM